MAIMKTLPVRLTNDEILERARQLVALATETDAAEAALATAKREHKSTLGHIDHRASKLRADIASGTTPRPVECYEEVDYPRGVVRTYRSDTYEQVGERPLSETERQLSLTAAKDAAATERRRVTEELVELQRVPPEDAP